MQFLCVWVRALRPSNASGLSNGATKVEEETWELTRLSEIFVLEDILKWLGNNHGIEKSYVLIQHRNVNLDKKDLEK